ncbi:MAG: hypothetical protein M1372_00745 [Patescibacteria group bacterium]|nr:hypothetical protein [Patescibacteria group bacterium]
MKFLKRLITGKPNNLSMVIIAIIAAIGSYLGSTTISNRNINSLQVQTNQKLQAIQSQSLQVFNQPKIDVLGDANKKEENNNGFNTDNWIFAYETSPNKEGYYCPDNPAFPSWFMWSKNKHNADFETQIYFSLLDRTDNGKNPTLYLSYGDKTGAAPDTFYRINILDGDLSTVRLYGRGGNNSLQFDRSIHRASLDKFITFTISPVFPNKKSSTLILNPVLSFQLDGKQYDFDSKKEFKVDLPLTSANEQGDGFQYGIGISQGDCFKIISSNI